MTFTTPIETSRLIIRPFQPGDWPSVLTYLSDPGVTAYLPDGVLNEDQVKAFIARSPTYEGASYAVVRKEANDLIGHLVYHPWFAPRNYEVGWVFHPQHQGYGYATEAARAALQHGFQTLGLHRIIATCQPENIASWRVMEKLGLRREGHFQKCIYRGGDLWWDEYFYAVLREEWKLQ